MVGYRSSVKRFEKPLSYKSVRKYFQVFLLAVVLGCSFTFQAYAKKTHGEADADGMKCSYSPQSINIGLFKFDKSAEASKKSTFFRPYIKATYRTYGWFFGYHIIQDEDIDLQHAECGWMIAMRFCARYALPAGGLMADGTTKDEADYGYDPGDPDDPEGTCVSKYRTHRGGDSPSLLDDPYYQDPVRLCAYEDSMDGMDTDSDYSPFHKNTPNNPPMDVYVQNYAMTGAIVGGLVGLLIPGAGLILAAVGAMLGALIALITSHYNHFVMAFTPGDSLGCVDIPMAPKPPPFYYQISEMPPWPQVYPVTDDSAYWATFVASTPSTYIQDYTSPKHPDNWRYVKNDDWFYPKIGVMLGSSTFEYEDGDGKRVLKTESPPARKTVVLTGDFYGEGAGPSYGETDAGRGRGQPLLPLTKPNDGTGTTQIRTVEGASASDPFRVKEPGDNDKYVGYDVTTEVYNDEICAYIIGSSWNFRLPAESGDPMPPQLGQEPELIGCVKRPKTYLKLDGTLGKAPPLPQVFHPWESSRGSLTPGNSAVSTYDKVRVWEWLADDPRHPSMMGGGVPNYASYHTDGVNEDSAKAAAAYDFAFALGMNSTTDPLPRATTGGPVLALVPKNGCDSPSSPDHASSNPQDYFKRNKQRSARIHGISYCMNNFDADGNGMLDPSEDDMCAQGISINSIGKTLQIIKNPLIPDHYEPVIIPGAAKVKVPTMPYTEIPGSDGAIGNDFVGTVYDAPAGTDINTLTDGSFVEGTRIFSTSKAISCPMELGDITTTFETDSQGQSVTVDTRPIQSATKDCSQMNIGSGNMYYRTPPDPYRGEMVMMVSGQKKLMRRVDKNNSPPNKYILKYPVFSYPRSFPAEGGTTSILEEPDPVIGECPLELQSDGTSLWQSLGHNNLCLTYPDGSPDTTTVPTGVYKNVPLDQRLYYPPDFHHGESLLVQSSLEQGLQRGYCVAMPPSQCEAEGVDPVTGNNTGKNITAGAPGVVYWEAAEAAAYCDPDADDAPPGGCPEPVVGKGIGLGACKLGYGVGGTYGTDEDHKPQRYCDATVSIFAARGEWGSMVASKTCERLTCPSETFHISKNNSDNLPIDYTCHLAADTYSDNGEDAPNGGSTFAEDDCSGSAGTLKRRKYCNNYGNWDTWSYDGLQAGKQGCTCDVGSDNCTPGCANSD